ncbi:MAG: cupin domain-containing protein [Burkholderiaceae bacterium]
MSGFRIRKLADTELVSYGSQSDLRVFIGDEQRSTPVRVALQTCQPGYDVPSHCHPYIEYLIVVEGAAEFRIESDGIQTVELRQGDVVELHPGVWHAFTTTPECVTRLLGIHISDERIVNYREGVKTDARGFRV